MVHNHPPLGQSQITKNTPVLPIFEFLYTNHPPEGTEIPLASVSERDSVWDSHRVQSVIIEAMYKQEAEFERYSERIGGCSGWLKFGFNEVNGLVLKQAFFCRCRYCSTCQWRKQLYWKAMMYQSYDEIRKEFPTHRFIFLTLTVKNPHIGGLRATLDHMNKSWQRLTQRKEFKTVVDGWIRTTEVTRPKLPRAKKTDPIVYCPVTKNTHAHPHFHCILMVKASYFSHGYIKQSDWVELWRDCLRVEYTPVVDVRTVKAKKGQSVNDHEAIKSAIAETIKYSTKPDELIHDHDNPQSREWFYELTRQTHKMRFVATGGALKNALRSDDEITNQDLIQTGNDTETEKTDDRRLHFTFVAMKGKYLYNPIYNE